MENYSIFSYLSAAIAYALLLLLSLWGIKRYTSGIAFFIAVLFSFFWSAYTSYNLYSDELFSSSILPFETLRNLAWYIYLLAMLSNFEQKDSFDNIKQSKWSFLSSLLFKANYSLALILGTVLIFLVELVPEAQFKLNQLKEQL